MALFFYREFTKLATGVSFFVLVASAVAKVVPGAPYPPKRLLVLPHFDLLRVFFFGASCNDKTTGNNGKRKIKFET